jgi:hypothetical protein
MGTKFNKQTFMFDGIERHLVRVSYRYDDYVAQALVELTDDQPATDYGYFPEWDKYEEQFVYYTAGIEELIAILGVADAFGDATLLSIDGYAGTEVES